MADDYTPTTGHKSTRIDRIAIAKTLEKALAQCGISVTYALSGPSELFDVAGILLDSPAMQAHVAEKRAEWEAELRQDATVHVEYRVFDTGHYTDPERQMRRIIKTSWLPVPDTTNHESEGKA